jgi:uncharacterized membrane protein YczE
MYYMKNAMCIILMQLLNFMVMSVQLSFMYCVSSSIEKLFSKSIHLVVSYTIFQRTVRWLALCMLWRCNVGEDTRSHSVAANTTMFKKRQHYLTEN